MAADVYAEARDLRGAGLCYEAHSLVESLRAGSTGTEVLMLSRRALYRLAASAELQAATREPIAALTAAVDKLFG